MNALLNGGLIGLSVATPIGPIVLLNIGRTLARGPVSGIVTGLGAATVHAVYASVAAFSASIGATVLQLHSVAFRSAGAVLLCVMGLAMFRRSIRPLREECRSGGLIGDYASAVGLAISNPITVSGFLVGMAAFGTSDSNRLEVVTGVVAASISWYTFVALAAGTLRQTLTNGVMRRINQLAAVFTFGMGLRAIAAALA
jgi:threonine/homoserine/homoserine lactone efflux protein